VSHEIIIIDHPEDPGLALAHAGSAVISAEVRWKPSHDLTPEQQIRRSQRAERLLGKIRQLLEAAPTAPDED
jgi:hypothetical protein